MALVMPTTPFPHEIWLHIAQFLPALVLRDLISLNSTFFDAAMDCRYRQMSFAYLDNRMIRSLARLKDPLVAKRVKILHVYPGFLKEALERQAEPALRRSFKCRLADLANFLLEQKFFPKPHPKFRMMRLLKRTEDVVQIMLEVLSGLPNITDYYVTWCGLPSISATASPFLSTVFQSNLRKLSLELSLENVKNLLTPSFQVQHLEELQLCIHTENIDSVDERNTILSDHLAPAISSLHATLHTLTLQSWEPADLSPMFYAIKRLPFLRELVVSIPVESIHLGDPKGFASFLDSQKSTLHTLRLRANQYSGPGLTPDSSFDAWIKDAIRPVRLPKLRVLDISSNLFPVSTSEFCLQHFSSTITSLSLTGSYRAYDNVSDLLDLVLSASPTRDEPLAKLRIGLVCLSPQLIDLIASKLPSLHRLELIVKYILPHANDHPELKKLCSASQGQLTQQIDEFIDQMQDRRYPFWNLRHMSILAESLPFRTEYEPVLEQTFLQSVPALKTFS